MRATMRSTSHGWTNSRPCNHPRCSAGTGTSTLKSVVNPWADVSAGRLKERRDFMTETKRDRDGHQPERQRGAPKNDRRHKEKIIWNVDNQEGGTAADSSPTAG